MDALRRAARSRDDRIAFLGPALVLVLGAFAYRPLVLNAFRVPADYEVERWFFAPDEKTPVIVLCIAAWLLWRRTPRLRSLPARRDPIATVGLLLAGAFFFVWAHLAQAADLLLPSLALHVLAFASALCGLPGARAVLLPAAVLLLAIPIPDPIRDELVWRLQGWSAQSAAWVMQTAGMDVALAGILFRNSDQSFVVIEACSGLRGIENLTLIALLVRELFEGGGRRQWLLVGIAPFVGFVINTLRIVLVASSADPQALAGEADHTPQGIAAVLVGTAILYALGSLMARGSTSRPAGAAGGEPSAGLGAPGPDWRPAGAWLVVLSLLSMSVPAFARSEPPPPPKVAFPLEGPDWTSESLTVEPHFLGKLPRRRSFYRQYEKKGRRVRPRVVYAFIGWDVPGNAVSSRLFTSKLSLPGPDWSPEESGRVQLWSLGVDARRTIASRDAGSEQALVYSWRLRDRGLWRESSRSFLALESGPLRRERERVVVRLVARLSNESPLARDRAKKLLDTFILDFREDLAGL